MNIQQLKYAVEVARSRSISRAAENLYISQPFLSKAIRELEGDIGIDIFNRTSRGVIPTKKGEEFLIHAQALLDQMEELETLYKVAPQEEYRFEITVPISCYISHAFVQFMQELSDKSHIKIDYLEANTMTAIDRVVDRDSNIGIIRYQEDYEDYFLRYVESKELIAKPLWRYEYHLVMSQFNPLAKKDCIDPSDLEGFIEISHGDPTVPALPVSMLMEMRERDASPREIVVYERQSQFELLCEIPNTYMWASPTPRSILERFPLVERDYHMPDNHYKDVFIYRKGYRLSPEDRLFLQKVQEEIDALERGEG